MTDFDRAFEIVIGLEGGYSNNVKDPGGETKFGISKKAHPSVDIQNLTMEQAKGIYAKDYWLAAGCPSLKWPMSLYVFDCAVNQGVSAASDLLNGARDPSLFMADRALRYMVTKNFGTFGRGWLKRLFAVVQKSL